MSGGRTPLAGGVTPVPPPPPGIDATARRRADGAAPPADAAGIAALSCARLLRCDPSWPQWPDRDRFLVSEGLVATLDGQLGSSSETLGSGTVLATATGMALGERALAAVCALGDGPRLVNHRTVALTAEASLTDPAAQEAAVLAGSLGLGRLIVCVTGAATGAGHGSPTAAQDALAERYAARGWHVCRTDAARPAAVIAALREARGADDRPSLVLLPTGDLAADDGDLPQPWETAQAGRAARERWELRLGAWSAANPVAADRWQRIDAGTLPDDLDASLPGFATQTHHATRPAVLATLRALRRVLPELLGAAVEADAWPTGGDAGPPVLDLSAASSAAGSVLCGLAQHGGLRPFVSTTLSSVERLKPSIRLAARGGLPILYVLTDDDSAALTSLRSVDNLAVLRPADAHEAVAAVRLALERGAGPTALVVSDRPVPVLGAPAPDALARHGARIVDDTPGTPDVVLVASGPEVTLARTAAGHLANEGVDARVVSAPWRERLSALDSPSAASLLPSGVPRVAVEATSGQDWERVVGLRGRVVDMDSPLARPWDADPAQDSPLSVEAIRKAVADSIADATEGRR